MKKNFLIMLITLLTVCFLVPMAMGEQTKDNKAEVVTKAKADTDAKAGTEAKADTDAKAGTEAKADTDAKAGTKAKLATEAKANSDDEVTTVNMLPFDRGYKYFTNEQYEKASIQFHEFISNNSRDVEDYEWAEFFLGVSLNKSGMSHASVDTLSWLVTRKPNTRIVTYILELFEELTRNKPFDRESIINRSICDQEYSFVDSNLANFINYHQGVFDWKNGFDQWGKNHFNQIKI